MQFQIYLGFFGLVQGCRGLVDIVDWRVSEVEQEGEEAISQVILVMLLFPNLTRCMLTNLNMRDFSFYMNTSPPEYLARSSSRWPAFSG